MHTPALRLRLEPSPWLTGVLALTHGAAAACAGVFLQGWWMPAVAIGAACASCAFHLHRDALLRAPDSVMELLLKQVDQCELVLRDGSTLSGRVDAGSFVSPLLTVVSVCVAGKHKRRSVVLLAGSAAPDDFRRARIRLLQAARGTESAGEPV